MDYGYRKKIALPFDEAVTRVTKVLAENGFGVLTTIDVKKTLKEKIGAEFKKYTILGACNPPRALKALTIEEEIGLLLPCNVIVYEKNKSVVVAAINPESAVSIVENKELEPLAAEVGGILKKVIDAL